MSFAQKSKHKLQEIDKEVRQKVKKAHDAAMADPIAPMDVLTTDIYIDTEPLTVRGATIDHPLHQNYTLSSQVT